MTLSTHEFWWMEFVDIIFVDFLHDSIAISLGVFLNSVGLLVKALLVAGLLLQSKKY